MVTVRLITGESFCSYCRRAIKTLKEIYPILKKRNVEVIQYDVRVRKDAAVKALKEKYGISWDIRPVTPEFIKKLKEKYEAVYVPLLEINGKRVPFKYKPEKLLETILSHEVS